MKQPADPMPLIVEPMLPTLVKYPFSNPDWLFEPKWDGFRAICFVENGEIKFVSRNKKSLTAKFPALQAIAKSIRATTAVLDGEIVAVDETGTPRFSLLRTKEDGVGHVVICLRSALRGCQRPHSRSSNRTESITQTDIAAASGRATTVY